MVGNAFACSYERDADPVVRRLHKHSNLGLGVAVGVPTYEWYV